MIEINNVSFKYSGADENAIEHFNLTVAKGEFVVLAGTSGCGKTTVTRLINKLIPEFYEGKFEGSVTIDGKDLIDVEIDSLAGIVGSVFQDPRSQFFATETNAEIAFSCENLNFDSKEIKRRVDQAIGELNLHHLMGKSIFKLSSGEKQSIAMASVYTLFPKVLVLDEPSSNLDMLAIENLRKTLALLKDKGVTIVISEHRLNYLRELADRILLMEKGQVESIFSSDEFYKKTNNQVNKMGLRSLKIDEINMPAKPIAEGMNAVSLKDIELLYEKKKSILKNIKLDIKRGSVVGLIGRNGAGKSTLMNIICGLQKQKKGTVKFNSKTASHHKRSANSYIVMQNSECQLFTESVEKELFLGEKLTAAKVEERSKVLLNLGLANLSNQHPASLSGGQKQRLAIALSYFKDTEIICMDEPTSGLDYNSMMKVVEFTHEQSSNNKTFLIATHDYEFLINACTHICFLDGGEVREYFKLENSNRLKVTSLLSYND